MIKCQRHLLPRLDGTGMRLDSKIKHSHGFSIKDKQTEKLVSMSFVKQIRIIRHTLG